MNLSEKFKNISDSYSSVSSAVIKIAEETSRLSNKGDYNMNEVQIFEGLKVKEENGQVLFDAETVALGIGLSTVAKSGNEVVRWQRVNQYLAFDNPAEKLKRGDFITEPQMYKLAIKANSPKAEKFQEWVTNDVLPTIRKHVTLI